MDASYEMAMPVTLPATGAETFNLWLVALVGAGLAMLASGLVLRNRAARVIVEK